ncbi:hypothetical protein Pelo_19101 [Pelomyxa schiedti]|nr:hypothetical protein Pelo_19101 [Pelomyxa schiedti]
MEKVRCVRARDQAAALLMCQLTTQRGIDDINKSTTDTSVHPPELSILHQSVLCELIIKSWVLATSRQVVLLLTGTSDQQQLRQSTNGQFDRTYVLVSVSHTLGVTGGTPMVLWNPGKELAVSCLSPTAWFLGEGASLYAVQLTSVQRDSIPVARRIVLTRNCVCAPLHNRKWLVVYTAYYLHALRVWKLDGCFFPQGDPLVLDVSGIEPERQWVCVKLFMTHSQPVECIGDGDELCIVSDLGCSCCVRLVDLQRCFDTRALVVAKEFSVERGERWNSFTTTHILSDRQRRLFVVHIGNHFGGTLIQDVVSGVVTVLDLETDVSPVDDFHYGDICSYQHNVSHFRVFETGTNQLVSEWKGKCTGYGHQLWGNGVLFKEYNRRIKCWDAPSGFHIASFTVPGDKDFRLSECFTLL